MRAFILFIFAVAPSKAVTNNPNEDPANFSNTAATQIEEAIALESGESRAYPYSELIEDESKLRDPLLSYKERRSTWGALFTFGYSTYSPMDYRPDFVVNSEYDEFYGSVDSPLLEIGLSAKVNLAFFSLAADFSGGFMENQGNFESRLTLIPLRLGATLALDGMFSEPYVVPYFGGGAYVVIYKEALASQSVEGRTSVAPYVSGGLRFQLDAIDAQSDDESLIEYGIENTFLYVEGRYFGATGDEVPDLSSSETDPIFFNVGLSLEF